MRRWRRRNARLVLLVACLAQFIVILDNAVVYVAIPGRTVSLTLSSSGQRWVVNTYALTFGGLLLLGGRLADVYGQRRMLVIGARVTLHAVECPVAVDPTLRAAGQDILGNAN